MSVLRAVEMMDRVNFNTYTSGHPALVALKVDRNYVPGKGSLSPRLVLVGDAPGRTEDNNRQPFSGPAGKVLNDWLWAAGLTRDRVYLTYLVKWWPASLTGNPRAKLTTRVPTAAEKEASLPYLLQELSALRATHVVLLGRQAGGAFLHKGYEPCRWYDTDYTFKACAVYHPATVCYQSGTKQVRIDEFKRVVREA